MALPKKLICALLAFGVASSAARAEITVAVASNFRAPAEDLAATFTKETGIGVRLIVGSSGKHAAAILNGAPIDVFLSADRVRPDALEKAGLVARRSTYAIGRLALYAPQARDGTAALEILSSGNFRRLAIADARLAPYGVAALQTLTSMGLLSALESKFVVAENIGQTFGFVATGNAEIGFVAFSQVTSPDDGTRPGVHLVAATLHDPIRQDAVLLERAKAYPEAESFFDRLFAPAEQALIRTYGYETKSP